MFPSSWTVAHERLQAAGVIKLEFAELPPEPREPRAAKRKDITQLSDKDAKQRLVEDADAVMAESVRPVWKEFISLLKSNQKSLSVDEQRYLLTLVEQVGSSPNPLGRTQPVTVELLMRSLQKIRPDYLTVEWAREL